MFPAAVYPCSNDHITDVEGKGRQVFIVQQGTKAEKYTARSDRCLLQHEVLRQSLFCSITTYYPFGETDSIQTGRDITGSIRAQYNHLCA